MAMAMRARVKAEQLMKLEDGAQMVIIKPKPNHGKKIIRAIELVLSSSPGNKLEAMTATVPGQTEAVAVASRAMPEPLSKPRWKSVFPAKKKSVKRMMFECIVRFIASFIRSQSG